MMGCFSTPKCEKRSSSAGPRIASTLKSVSTIDSLSLLSNKPVELPDPRSIRPQAFAAENYEHWSPKNAKLAASRFSDEATAALSDHTTRTRILNRAGGRTSFSGPLVRINEAVESSGLSRVTPNYISSDEGKKSCGMRTLRRSTSFGGRPQPLPLPVAEEIAPKGKQVYLPLPAPEEARYKSGKSLPAPTSRTRSFMLEDGAGSWSARRGRVTPVGGLPLPPPSVASKLMPRVAVFQFRDLVLATNNFASSCCVEKGAFGALYSVRIWDSTSQNNAKIEAAVLRLPDNAGQGCLEWKSEVQLLAQLSNANLCAVKGYCTDEAGSRLSTRARRRERLLVFEQPSNGSLYDHLVGSRCTTCLDWNTRLNIALGAACGLLYIHERSPLQIFYNDFTSSNVLLEKDYSPKLAGYGLCVTASPVNRDSSSTTSTTLTQADATNIWSFGVLLLELLTGKSSRDAVYFGDANNFVQWGRQFMKEESKLSHIIDHRMRGGCPIQGAMEVVTLLLQCVSKVEAQRPSMSEIVGTLRGIKVKQCSNATGALPLGEFRKMISGDYHLHRFANLVRCFVF